MFLCFVFCVLCFVYVCMSMFVSVCLYGCLSCLFVMSLYLCLCVLRVLCVCLFLYVDVSCVCMYVYVVYTLFWYAAVRKRDVCCFINVFQLKATSTAPNYLTYTKMLTLTPPPPSPHPSSLFSGILLLFFVVAFSLSFFVFSVSQSCGGVVR